MAKKTQEQKVLENQRKLAALAAEKGVEIEAPEVPEGIITVTKTVDVQKVEPIEYTPELEEALLGALPALSPMEQVAILRDLAKHKIALRKEIESLPEMKRILESEAGIAQLRRDKEAIVSVEASKVRERLSHLPIFKDPLKLSAAVAANIKENQAKWCADLNRQIGDAQKLALGIASDSQDYLNEIHALKKDADQLFARADKLIPAKKYDQKHLSAQ